jgi:hypothetical protein
MRAQNEALRKPSGSSQEALRKPSGSSQEALRKPLEALKNLSPFFYQEDFRIFTHFSNRIKEALSKRSKRS